LWIGNLIGSSESEAASGTVVVGASVVVVAASALVVVVGVVSPPSEPQADATSASDMRISINRFNIELPL
jgi:hypothetical protein